jgi:hypothetical protein
MDNVIVTSKTGKTKRQKPIRYIDGYSESLWKSVVVKSLRMGWPEGLRQAAKRLTPSTVKSLLVCGLFEDVFPPPCELQECLDEIAAKDYDALCSRQTHHARGYTSEFCNLEDEAVSAAQSQKSDLWAEARKYNLWLPPRSLNCFYTWLRLRPVDAGAKREIDDALLTGMPKAMADGHTVEGKALGAKVTVLSGHYSQHQALSKLVERGGWGEVRRQVHANNLQSPQAGIDDPRDEGAESDSTAGPEMVQSRFQGRSSNRREQPIPLVLPTSPADLRRCESE